jgi:hypothetical protein
MTPADKADRLRIIDIQLGMAGLPDEKRKKLEEEKARLQAGTPNGQDGEIDWSAVPPAAGFASMADFATEAARLATLPEHEYDRCRKAEAERLGVRLETLDRAVKGLRPPGAAEITDKVKFVALGTELLDLWHDKASVAWCWTKEHGPGCTWRVQSKETRIYLLRAYGVLYQTTLDDGRKVPAAPSKQAVAEAMDQLEAIAYGGERRPEPALRVGGDSKQIVIDLCNDDHTVAVVTAEGWQVVKPSPIPMRRVDGMYPLPMPVIDAGDALKDLRKLLSLMGPSHDVLWSQLVGFQFACLRPVPPYFLLGLFEEQGKGKTTTGRILRQAIDPHEVERQPKPKSVDDLFVCTYGQWLPLYDNLSSMSQDYSDAFCSVSTGATHSKKELYTDFGVIRLKVARPQIITAIVDVVAAPDLLDRSLVAKLAEIAEIIDDEDLLAASWALAPRILGQLLDAAVLALRDFGKTKLEARVRMVGPTRWIEAGAPALGLAPGTFTRAYLASVEHAHEIALEASVIGGPLRRMLDHRDASAMRRKSTGATRGRWGSRGRRNRC